MNEITIDVHGHHSVKLPPERGTVDVRIGLEGPRAQPVLDDVIGSLNEVRASIERLHDGNRGPITWFSIDQVRTSWRRPKNKAGVELSPVHTAEAGVSAKFLDFDELGRWVRWAAGVDGLTVSGIGWDLTAAHRDEVVRETRKEAVRDARSRAQDYADALDLGPVHPRRIGDPEVRRHEQAMGMTRHFVSERGGFDDLSFTPEFIRIGAQVEATFVVAGGREVW